jgi:AbrB family looped-hinge helix DNA binding protein
MENQAMLVNVMEKGLVTLPKKIRDELHIAPGDAVDVEVRDGEVVLRPVKVIPRSQAYFWTEKVQKRIKESEKDIETGRYKDYDSADKLLKDLHGED